MIPINFTARTGQKVWCDRSLNAHLVLYPLKALEWRLAFRLHWPNTQSPVCQIFKHFSRSRLNLTLELKFPNKGLFTPWTMQVVPRPYKIYDWLLNSSRYHFSLHQGKDVKLAIELKAPKRHILRPTLSTDMVQWILRWGGKRGALVRIGKAHDREVLLYYSFNLLLFVFFIFVFWRSEDR